MIENNELERKAPSLEATTSSGGDEYNRRLNVEVTNEMLEAGIERFLGLLQAGVGSDYLVTEVFLAMYSHLDRE